MVPYFCSTGFFLGFGLEEKTKKCKYSIMAELTFLELMKSFDRLKYNYYLFFTVVTINLHLELHNCWVLLPLKYWVTWNNIKINNIFGAFIHKSMQPKLCFQNCLNEQIFLIHRNWIRKLKTTKLHPSFQQRKRQLTGKKLRITIK